MTPTALITKYSGLIYSIALNYTDEFVMDVSQEALIKVINSDERWHTRNGVYTVAKNRIIDVLKSKAYIRFYRYSTATLAKMSSGESL